MELYTERGFDQTTVAEIAGRAGLTERTFFRYFADKREVLFSGAAQFQEMIVSAVAHAPAEAAPLDAVGAALEAAGVAFEPGRAYSRVRQGVIDAQPELQERELKKMATLARGIAGVLRDRGVAEPGATLTAEAGIAVFRVAFERWVTGLDERTLAEIIRASIDDLRAVVGASGGEPSAVR
jgi:AcrR family transcriptional regulator